MVYIIFSFAKSLCCRLSQQDQSSWMFDEILEQESTAKSTAKIHSKNIIATHYVAKLKDNLTTLNL